MNKFQKAGFENITDEDIVEAYGSEAEAFNIIEQENIALYLSQGMSEKEAKMKAAERKKNAMRNSL